MKEHIQERPGTWRLLISSALILCASVGLVTANDLSFSLSDAIGYDGTSPEEQGTLLVRFVDTDGPPATCPDLVGPRTARSVRERIAGTIMEGASIEQEYDGLVQGLTRVRLPKGRSVVDALAEFGACEDVLYAEPNYKYSLCRTPNDPQYVDQWALNNTGQTGGREDADIDAPEAWDIQTGDRSIIVAILDTGIDTTHPELVINLWMNNAEMFGEPDVDDDGNGYADDFYGYDFVNDVPDPVDDVYHGTHVAGIIGAFTNNMMGIAGVCWNVTLMPLKVADADGVNLDAAVAAIEYAVKSGAKIINASWASEEYSESLKNAIEAAGEQGVLFVAAAGNGSGNIDNSRVYPACYDAYNIISVLATDSEDRLSWSSNYGRASVDLGEPGEEVLSTLPMEATGPMTEAGLPTEYGTISGTSVAGPHVAGAAALLWSEFPPLSYYHVKHALMQTTDKVLGGLCLSQGRLNMARALQAIPQGQPGRVLNTRDDPADSASFYFSIQAAIDDANDGDVIIVEGGPENNTIYLERIDFKGKAITLRSGSVTDPNDETVYPDTTFILGLAEEGSLVTFANAEGPDTVLKGFTIGWGVARYGAGIRCENASPTISYCIISNNQASKFGGGIDCFGGSPEITNCVISDNRAFGADAAGGGINIEDGSPVITNCIIRNNSSTNIGGGLACYNQAAPKLFNCFITNNAAVAGSGQIDVDASSPTITNCTIVVSPSNPARDGGIACFGGAEPTITNCILWGNGDDLYNCSATYSCIEDIDDAGEGVTHDDPQFTRGPRGVYYLSQIEAGQLSGSPCVDAGDPNTDPNFVAFLGNMTTRTDGVVDLGVVDLGAHFGAAPAQMFPLNVAVVNARMQPIDPNEAGGYVDPNGGSFREFEVVHLTAYPKEGYRIKRWIGTPDDSSLDPNVSFTMFGPTDIMIEFEKIPSYTLETSVKGAHRSTDEEEIPTLTPYHPRGALYPDGTVVQLVALPPEGYIVDKWEGTDDDGSWANTNTVTIDSNKVVTVSFRMPQEFRVPGQYPTIAEAMAAAADHGDKVIVGAGVYRTTGLDFDGKALTVASERPDDPCCVAETIIDCDIDGDDEGDGRAFILQSGEGQDSVIDGFTIRNGWAVADPNTPEDGGGTGAPGTDAFGGAIACFNGSSPTLSHLIIQNCRAQGKVGEDGSFVYDPFPAPPAPADPDPPLDPLDPPGPPDPNDPNAPADPNAGVAGEAGEDGAAGADGADGAPGADGYNGGRGGHGYGGALYFDANSAPIIWNVVIENSRALGGNGGFGGTGQDGGDGADGQNGQDGQAGQDGGEGIDDGPQGAGGNGGAGGDGGNGGAGGAGGRGGDGGDAGEALGGAMYFGPGCKPIIRFCRIVDSSVKQGIGAPGGAGGAGGSGGNAGVGGVGGEGGEGEPAGEAGADGADGVGGNGGPGGAGGSMGRNGDRAWGGAIYFGEGCQVKMSDTVISYSSAVSEDVNAVAYEGGAGGNGGAGGSPGGNGGDGGAGGDGNPVGPAGNPGAAGTDGGDGNPGEAGGTDSSITTGFGGAIYYDRGCVVELTDCSIGSSSIDGESGGGEHYAEGCKATLLRCTISNNTSAMNGGGQSFEPSCSLTATQCSYLSNVATLDGGGLYVPFNCVVDINDSTFQDNQALTARISSGGAIYGGGVWSDTLGDWYNGGSLHVRGTDLLNNRAAFGGSMYWYGLDADVSIFDCVIRNNQAEHGGGLYWSGGDAEVVQCSIRDNIATGPATTVDVPAPMPDPNDPNTWPDSSTWPDPNDPNSMFDPNNAWTPPALQVQESTICGSGGGLLSWDADSLIQDCIIGGNTSFGGGGGVYLGGTSYPVLKNCLVKDNTAFIDGGGIATYWDAVPTITNCTIVDNQAYDPNEPNRGKGGGLSCTDDSKTTLINSIVGNNQGQLGSQIAIGSESDIRYAQYPSTLTVSYSAIEGGQGGIHVEPGRVLNWLNGNIQDDPLFTESYFLSQIAAGQPADSPCVDAGSASALTLGLDTYTTRTDDVPDAGTVDMGFHYMGLGRFHLTVNAIGNGTVTPSDVWFYEFQPVTLVAQPAEGYRVRQWIGTDDDDPSWNKNRVTVAFDGSATVTVEFERDITNNLMVPDQYPTIEAAVAAAGPGGNNIVVRQGVHSVSASSGIDFQGKIITLTSMDPNDPNVVANTIIECNADRFTPRRAFHFHSGEDPNVVVTGLTIRGGYMRAQKGQAGRYGVLTPDPYERTGPQDNDPPRAERGQPATGDAYGGGILCENGSSPTFRNCVIADCTVTGAHGGDGADGQTGAPNPWSYQIPGEDNVQTTNENQWGGHGETGTGTGFGGGLAARDGSRPVLIGCTFENNTAMGGVGGEGGDAGSHPGGVQGHGGDGGNGVGDGRGGAIYVDQSSAPVVRNCRFINNVARTGMGGTGGLTGEGTDLAAPRGPAADGSDGSAVSTGTEAGGAVYYASGTTADYVDSIFTRNAALQVSAGFDFGGAGFTTVEVETAARGGAVYSETGNTISLVGCLFEDHRGGAIYVEGSSTVDVNDCRFTDNSLSGVSAGSFFFRPGFGPGGFVTPRESGGGAIHVGPNCAQVNFAHTRFFGNSTDDAGGAVRLRSSADFVHCVFGGNSSGNNGGALDVYHDTGDSATRDVLDLRFAYCSFRGNRANVGLDGWGGAIRAQDVNAVLTDCDFTHNTAKNGGALFTSASTLSLTGSLISGNRGTGASQIDTAAGFDTVGRFGVSHSMDLGTGTDAGGALFCADSAVTIADCTLSDNAIEGVNGAGGAIAFHGGFVPHVVRNCLITGNSASKYGGAVSCDAHATPTLQNCTFVANTAGALGGATYCDWSSDITILNSIFQNNSNRAIALVDSDAQTAITHCLFDGNPQGDYGVLDSATDEISQLAGPEVDATNLSGSAQFATGPFGAYYLGQTAAGQPADSPALDAGLGAAADYGLDTYTTRTDNGLDEAGVDLGYHYPDPNTLAQYQLTAEVLGEHGTVAPASGTYYAGTPVTVTATPDQGYRVRQWTGTNDDATHAVDNLVVMWSDRDVTVEFEQPRTIKVGTDPNYTSIMRAIDEAVDGDVVMLPTGVISPPYNAFPHPVITVDKAITLTSENPDDPDVVAGTVIHYVILDIATLDSEAVIDGLTVYASRMHITGCSPTVRNCVFKECHWFGIDGRDGDAIPQPPHDGEDGASVPGGAMTIVNGSPTIQNCTFDNCSAEGGDGGNGSNAPGVGRDGGWAGGAYGGAVYCGFNSNPTFTDCAFVDCVASGGNGGNGGDATGIVIHGGRAGNFVFSPSEEAAFDWYWWDGWEWGWYDSAGLPMFGGGHYKDYWKYSGYGGAVYCENESSPKFLRCTFTNTRTHGGITGVGGTPFETLEPTLPINIENFGGALYASYGCNPELVDCTFTNCFADLQLDPNTLPDPNGVIDPDNPQRFFTMPDDIYLSYGGALAFEDDCSPKMVNCKITNCEATNGGAIWWSDSKLEIVDSTITDNHAYNGAGLYSVEATGTITNTTVARNLAFVDPSDPNGPLALDGSIYPFIDRPPVIDPNADPNAPQTPGPGDEPEDDVPPGVELGTIFSHGGGYYCFASVVDIKDSVFTQNEANGSGGGIFYSGSDMDLPFAPSLHNTLVTKNVSARDGGGISATWFAEPTISSCTIADNKVTGALGDGAGYGGGLYVAYESNAIVRDSIIWGNLSVDGSQIAVGTWDEYQPRPSTITISNTDIGPRFDPNQLGPIGLIAAEGVDDEPPVGPIPDDGDVYTDRAEIFKGFTEGQDKVKVIVTLAEPTSLKASTDWDSPDSVELYRKNITARRASVLESLQPGDFVERYTFENVAAFSGEVTRAGLEKMASHPLVRHIEPVRYVQPALAQALSVGNAKEVRHIYSGQGVSIAIVDSGIDYTHPMLGGGGFPNTKVIGGFDVGGGDFDPMPTNPHGTACAGIAGGSLATVGDYIGGVAYGSKLYALKLTTDDEMWPTDAGLRAWDWCITHRNDDLQNPIKVISNSWGIGFPFDDTMMADEFSPGATAVARMATDLGITILAASGNDGFPGWGIEWPAAMSDVISVGALYDTTSAVTNYSNAGDLLDILAPADPVYTADIVGFFGYTAGDYFPYFNGTSSACPFAAGCVASIQNAARQRIGRFLSPAEVKELLIRTGDPITDTKVDLTKPRVNLGAAVMSPFGPPIYLSQNSVLNGWVAPESDNYDAWQPAWWGADVNVLEVDPLFVSGYLLSQIAAGQDVDSPVLDAGSVDANDPVYGFDPDTYTTRTDGVGDVNILDLGYHYPIESLSELTVAVVDVEGDVLTDPNLIHGYVDPNSGLYTDGAVIDLIAHPDPNWRVAEWSGTDDDDRVDPNNTVTMAGDRYVTVRFEEIPKHALTVVAIGPGVVEPNQGMYNEAEVVTLVATPEEGYRVRRWIGADVAPGWNQNTNTITIGAVDAVVTVEFEEARTRNILVPKEYETIEEAVAAASPGDTNIIISEGVYTVTSPMGIDLQGKRIRIMSTDPNDPNIVAQTIIDCGGDRLTPRRAFHFHSGEPRDCIVTGLTIRNAYWAGAIGGIEPNAVWGMMVPDDPNDLANTFFYMADGADANGVGYGGAILCENASSPTISKCVIEDCTVVGAQGGDGLSGMMVAGDTDGDWGGDGGDGRGTGYGGAIACLGGSQPRVVNCTIRNCTARGGMGGNGGNGSERLDGGGNESWGGDGGNAIGDGRGGAVYCAEDSNAVFESCRFVNNSATTGLPGTGGRRGGGAALDPPAFNGSSGTTLSEGTVWGGAVYQEGASPTFVDCTFINNKAYESYAYSFFSGLYIEDLETEEIVIYSLGGALYAAEGTTVAPERCTFTGNMNSAIYVPGKSVIDINECSFSKNETSSENSEFRSYNQFIFLDGEIIDTFDPNEVFDYSGGALYVGPSCPSVTLRNSQFYSNKASMQGGAVRLMSDANMVGCSFSGNKAEEDGGAIEAYYSTGDPQNPLKLQLHLDSCTFGGNQAHEGKYGQGGALHFVDFNAVLTDCYFLGNKAKNGGAMFLTAGTLTLKGGGVVGNTALGGSGLDTRIESQEDLFEDIFDVYDYTSIFDIYFRSGSGLGAALDTDAVVDVGGGIVCAATDADIANCTFMDNRAEGVKGAGGALSFYGGFVGHTVKNCLFKGNWAEREGGAIACGLFATPVVTNSTFVENTAERLGGAIFCDWDSDVTVADSIFQANEKYAIGEENFANSTVEHCLFHENSPADFAVADTETQEINTLAGADLDVTNIEGDPLFVKGTLGDFYLSQTEAGEPENSPALDAGSGFAEDLSLALRTTRTDGIDDSGVVDLGFHYVDHTGLPKYTLTTEVVGGRGTVGPTLGQYYAGTAVPVVATPDSGWRIAQWAGTTDDASKSTNNLVIMGPDRHVTVEFEQPRTIFVSADPGTTTIQHAIDQAEEGDVIVVKPGSYEPASWYEYPWNYIRIRDKNITLMGSKPDDPNAVASTFLHRYIFEIENVGPETVIEGLTIGDVNWVGADGLDGPDINIDPDGQHDGEPGSPLAGGAMVIYNASPTIRNCVFRDCSIQGGDGGDGSGGHDGHSVGYDGGWAGYAYGGAVYCGYQSSPTFENCSFTNCRAIGGNGGNGGNGQNAAQGGRGGNWMLSDAIEQSLLIWWDGWEWGPFDEEGNLREYWMSGLGQATRGYFDDYWKYSGYGGAVYCEYYSSPRFIDCTFTDNHTFGGVCGVGGTTDTIPDRSLNIENFGGAVYIGNGSNPEFIGCLFQNNTADMNTVDVPDDIYVSYGGSIAFEDDCSPVFIGCTIEDSNAAIGGGMWWSNSAPTIIDCNVAGNMAYHGGGFYSVNSAGIIEDTIVQRNLALLSNIDPNLLGDPNAPSAGVMGWGGGYAAITSPVEIVGSTFADNRALSSGGGLYLAGSDEDVNVAPTLRNCLIVGNSSGRDGGGISTWLSEPVLSNCTIADNVVAGPRKAAFGGGIFLGYGSNAWMQDSIVWGNESTYLGSQIAVAHSYEYGPSPSTLHLTHSDVQPTLDPNEANGDALDLVFVFDTTDSMTDSIDAIQAAGREIVEAVAASRPDYRMAVVDFKDFNEATGIGAAGDYPFRVVLPFTEDLNRLVTSINSLTTPAGSGGGAPESVYYALTETIDSNDLGGWRTGKVDRIILLIGDEPPHHPEPITGFTAVDVARAAMQPPSKRVFAIQVGDDPQTALYFGSVTGAAGGALLTAEDANDVVETVFESIGMITLPAPSIYVSETSRLPGWDGQEELWDPNTDNMDEDPLFIAGYYLSQVEAGQTVQSPAVDAGSSLAGDPRVDLATRTTRTDGLPDEGAVDLGYHYVEGVTLFTLTTEVLPDPNDGLTHGTVDPALTVIYEGAADNVITVEAVPEDGWKVLKWTGTDDDESTSPINYVTLTSDRHVTVSFEKRMPRVVTVPGDYPRIQDAVTYAEDGDTIVVDPGTYYSGYSEFALIVDKAVTITSRNPEDPCMVAATVIDGSADATFPNMGVLFLGTTDSRTVLNGFTIENCGGTARSGGAGDRAAGHPNGEDGYPIQGGAMIVMPGASPIVKNCVFRNNSVTAGDGGDGVAADATNNAGRGGWGGWARGGAIYCAPQSGPTFVNCIIEDNFAQGGNGGNGGAWSDGGGLANYGGNYTPPFPIDIDPDRLGAEAVDEELWNIWQWDHASWFESAFSAESISTAVEEIPLGGGPYVGDYRWYSGYGGGVFVDTGSNVKFIHCTIRRNETIGGLTGQGGTQGDLGRNVEPLVPFEVPSYGGGVYCAADTTVEFKGCTFADNVASGQAAFRIDPYLGHGGGVAAEMTALVSFADCNFADNVADTGGGLYVADAVIEVNDCNFVSNTALRGGGLTGIGGLIDVLASVVQNNEAILDAADVNDIDVNDILPLGAGMFLRSMDALVQDCNIVGNVSAGSGGGIYVRGEDSTLINNCMIQNNGAARDGGGISTNWHATPVIRNCTFVGNAAPGSAGDPDKTGLGGAVFCGYESECTIVDSILWDNWARLGTELAVGSGFELDRRCGKINVSYSNIFVGPNDVWVEEGCEVVYGEGIIHAEPLFATGLLGTYYLSNGSVLGEGLTSPCVDAGSDLAGNLGMARYTTRTDRTPDTGRVDIGFHYPILEPCKFCDLVFDGVIQFNDFAVFSLNWLDEGCSEADGWCDGADFTFDSQVNVRDLAFFADCWLVRDTTPPVADPSLWEIEPFLDETIVGMTVKEAFDAWGGPVEYFFQCQHGDCQDSGWQSERTYWDRGVAPGMAYGYRVKARDARGNETKWSETRFAGAQDTTPPTPAPIILSIDPNSSQTLILTARPADDENLVQYRFQPDPNFPGAHDSGWLDTNVYTDVNLAPGTTYGYRVKARDLSGNLNETPWSAWVYATTLTPAELNPPLPNPAEFDPNGLPREYLADDGDPETFGDYWVEMMAVTAVDDSGGLVQYFFECRDRSDFSSGWIDQPIYRVYVGRQNQALRFRVWARDEFGNMTGASETYPAIARPDQAPLPATVAGGGGAAAPAGGGAAGGG